jgi:hypothetical protein
MFREAAIEPAFEPLFGLRAAGEDTGEVVPGSQDAGFPCG